MLEKSRIYATLLKERMDQARANMEHKASSSRASSIPTQTKAASSRSKGKKRTAVAEEEEAEQPAAKKSKTDTNTDEEKLPPIEQPRLVTGTKLKDYQLEGLAWMASLYENGISGILGAPICLCSL
jgi:ATP-dependent DNA helicase